jgi:hypothetical protein
MGTSQSSSGMRQKAEGRRQEAEIKAIHELHENPQKTATSGDRSPRTKAPTGRRTPGSGAGLFRGRFTR